MEGLSLDIDGEMMKRASYFQELVLARLPTRRIFVQGHVHFTSFERIKMMFLVRLIHNPRCFFGNPTVLTSDQRVVLSVKLFIP